MQVELRIRRYNPEIDQEPHWEEYDLEAEPTDRVLDLLHQVKWYQDGTLTFRRSCAHGVCGSDAMLINGRNRLACETSSATRARRSRSRPIRGMPVVKDLLVDMEPFWAKYRNAMPYLVNDEVPEDGMERRQSPADRARYEDTSRCILCAACTTSCPVFWSNPDYVGPAAIVNAHRFIVDSRDTRPRRAPRDHGRPRRRLALPDDLQLRRGLPAGHQDHPRHPRGDQGDRRAGSA